MQPSERAKVMTAATAAFNAFGASARYAADAVILLVHHTAHQGPHGRPDTKNCHLCRKELT